MGDTVVLKTCLRRNNQEDSGSEHIFAPAASEGEHSLKVHTPEPEAGLLSGGVSKESWAISQSHTIASKIQCWPATGHNPSLAAIASRGYRLLIAIRRGVRWPFGLLGRHLPGQWDSLTIRVSCPTVANLLPATFQKVLPFSRQFMGRGNKTARREARKLRPGRG